MSSRLLLTLLVLSVPTLAQADEGDPPPVPAPEAPAGQKEPAAEEAPAEQPPVIQRRLTLSQAEDGKFSGRWTVTKDKEETVTEIGASTLATLRKDHPEVANIVVAAGGLKPRPGFVGTTRTATEIGGLRRTVVRTGSQETLAEYGPGFKPHLRITNLEAGTITVEDYQAPSLKALGGQYPKIGRKFEETLAEVPPRRPPPPAFVTPGFNPIANQERTIAAWHRGAQVDIEEVVNRSIKITITRTVDGKPVAEVFSAANAGGLQEQSPEAADLYRRFTGIE